MLVYINGKVDRHFGLAPPPDVRSQSPRVHVCEIKLVSGRTLRKKWGAREASMRVRDLLGEKQTMAGNCPGRIVVWLGKLSWDAEPREGSQGHRDLVGFQIRACQVPP
jgi:hypothetical protein